MSFLLGTRSIGTCSGLKPTERFRTLCARCCIPYSMWSEPRRQRNIHAWHTCLWKTAILPLQTTTFHTRTLFTLTTFKRSWSGTELPMHLFHITQRPEVGTH